jgi:hypothetical protein
LVGLVVGPVSGVIGFALRSRTLRWLAAGGLTAVSIAEPLAWWAHILHFDARMTYVIVALMGAAIPVAVLRTEGNAMLRASALALSSAYPLAVLVELVLIGLGQVSAPMRLI